MRLIDADNFENRIYHEVFEKDSDMQKWDSGCWIRYKLVENVLREQPTIASEPHWIPVTERLPENNDPVNVTWINHNPEVYYMDIKDKPFTATAHYHKGHWYWYSSVTQDYLNEYDVWTPDLIDKDVEITAWMPLPEPMRMEKQ